MTATPSAVLAHPDSRAGHREDDPQMLFAAAAPTDPTMEAAVPMKSTSGPTPAGQPAQAMTSPPPSLTAPRLADPLLALAADVLTDLEDVRVANENRLRQLTRDTHDRDGEHRGFGLDVRHPDVARLAVLVEALKAAEHDADLQLRRRLRKHPLGPWIAATNGVGERQGARLLGAIGDPFWNPLHHRPRTVSELWAYCGYHVLRTRHTSLDTQENCAGAGLGDPGHSLLGAHLEHAGVAATRRRGARMNWSPTAKVRAHLIAVSCVKVASSTYRAVYDQARQKYADAAHAAPCVRCGPSGHPAAPGTLLSPGHQHARGLRLVAKTVLRDLWREARRLHLEIDTEMDK